jgi:hypothetical protein
MTVYAGPRFTVEPFPPLRWTGVDWEGSVTLPAWREFASRPGSFARERGFFDTAVRLRIAAPGGRERPEPSAAQANAYRYLVGHDAVLRDNIVRALYLNYPALKAEYDLAPDQAHRMPDLTAPDDLRNLCCLTTIHLFDTSWDGASYVGFEFGCTWDDDGMGVMTHRGRMVEIGGPAVAYEEWLARRDLDSMNE